MTINCDWFHTKIEAYFAETLNSEELQLCKAHLAACADCNREVEDLEKVDPLIQYSFKRRLATARLATQRNTRPRVIRLALAGATLALAAALGITALIRQETPEPVIVHTTPEITLPSAPSEQTVKKQTPATDNSNLGKPNEGVAPVTPLQPDLDQATADGPEFAIIDSVGQSNTLETYRGRVLLFGVLSSDQKEATANLQELYEAFGSNPRVRILGVANHREDKFGGTTFPVFFNHGSKLLGVKSGQFMLLDTTGSSKLTGSLSDAGSAGRIRNQLGQLGIK